MTINVFTGSALIGLIGFILTSCSTPSAPEIKAEAKKPEWQNTTISEATIKKIHDGKAAYNKCIVTEMQKSVYVKADSRHATESIIKSCETVLSNMRTIYLEEKVPEIIADRHLKQMRTQTTRNVLQQMMMNDAARQAAANK